MGLGKSLLAAAISAFVFLAPSGALALDTTSKPIAPSKTLPKTATPATWRLKTDKADVTFLGSIHLLPPGISWRTPVINEALKRAEVVVFEAPEDGSGGRAPDEIMQEMGTLKDGKALNSLLRADLITRFEEAAWRVNYPAQRLQTYEPWFASVMLELFLYVKKGFSPYYGVDSILSDEAKDDDKTLAYLETVEEQLSYLGGMSRSAGLKMLEETVNGILTKPDEIDRLIVAWAAGDAAGLDAVAKESMDKVPELVETLLIRRNRAWIPKIEAMIASGKPHFIIVGAAHLAGKDSVIELLRARGHTIDGP